jgi:hypothetical protein
VISCTLHLVSCTGSILCDCSVVCVCSFTTFYNIYGLVEQTLHTRGIFIHHYKDLPVLPMCGHRPLSLTLATINLFPHIWFVIWGMLYKWNHTIFACHLLKLAFFFLFSKMPLPLKGKFVIKKAKSSKLNALIVWHVLGFKLRLLIYSGFPSCHLRSNFYHFISCMFKFSDKASGVGSETSMAWLLLQFASLSS